MNQMHKLKPNLTHFFAQFLVLTIGWICALNCLANDNLTNHRASQVKLKVNVQLQELGHTIGDIAEQTLVVTTPLGYVFDKSTLPAIGANSSPVELVSFKVKEKDSQNATQHFIHLRWQHFRSMPEIRYYPLVPLNLKFTHESKDPLSVYLAASQILVAPLIPTVIAGDAYKNLQPDVKPAYQSLSLPISLLLVLVVCGIACIVYLAWYFDWWNWRFAHTKPFRKANREIRQLKNAPHDMQQTTAICALRRGFDGANGNAVSAENLPQLFESKKWLSPYKNEIEDFFADSEQVFFAGKQSTWSFQKLYKLSQNLMQVETSIQSTPQKNLM